MLAALLCQQNVVWIERRAGAWSCRPQWTCAEAPPVIGATVVQADSCLSSLLASCRSWLATEPGQDSEEQRAMLLLQCDCLRAKLRLGSTAGQVGCCRSAVLATSERSCNAHWSFCCHCAASCSLQYQQTSGMLCRRLARSACSSRWTVLAPCMLCPWLRRLRLLAACS